MYDYRLSIDLVLEAAKRYKPQIHKYLWSQPGPKGEPLYVHRLCFGDPEAKKVAAITGGLHGVEGDAVMEAFRLMLVQGLKLRPGTALYFFAPLEPWAHANEQRAGLANGNRGNLLLNKEGVRETIARQTELFGQRLHIFRPTAWSAELQAEFAHLMETKTQEMRAIGTVGQNGWNDAISFTGDGICESGQIMYGFAQEMNAANIVAFAHIDGHSGLGDFAKGDQIAPTFDAKMERTLRRIHGNSVQFPNRPKGKGKSVAQQLMGTLQVAMEEWFECRKKAFVTIEMGPGGHIGDGLQDIVWGNYFFHHPGTASPEVEARWRKRFIQRFRPDDLGWYTALYSRLINTLEQSMEFLAPR